MIVMPFPAAPRVTYGKTSLVETICQLRFTPVLRIEHEVPVELQELLRRRGFPRYERREIIAPEWNRPVIFDGPGVEHFFSSLDNTSTIVVGRNAVAVDTTAYAGWDQFARHVLTAAAAVRDVYGPSSITRTGLRYKNLIRRSMLGLIDVPWVELLRRDLIGLLAVHPELTHTSQEAVIPIEDGRATARISHGLVEVDGEPSYLIDSDFYVQGLTGFDDFSNILEMLHKHAWSAFAWCLTPRLHEAMQPEPWSERGPT